MKNLLLLLIVLLGLDTTYAQDCSLQGTVTDALSGRPLIFATVAIYSNDQLLTSTETDINGKYCVPELKIDIYQVEVYYIGYFTSISSHYLHSEPYHNITLSESMSTYCDLVVTPYNPPLIDLHNTSWTTTYTAKGIRRSPR